mmetsp:Transcript_12949/g.27309  ORF Transcript_12949/g.27309 Transcript_12949/m.27309 type:complete len:282 (-) Transcript_12949:2130-2975(-)
MVKTIMTRRLLFALLLPAAVAFTSKQPASSSSSRIGNNVNGRPLFAAKDATKAAADALTEAVSSSSSSSAPSLTSSWNDLTNKLTSAGSSGSAEALADPKEALAALTSALDSLLHQSVGKMEALLQQINEAFAGLLASIANGGAAGLYNDPFLNLEPILSKISESASALGISSGDVSKITGLVERATGALNTPETIAITTVLTSSPGETPRHRASPTPSESMIRSAPASTLTAAPCGWRPGRSPLPPGRSPLRWRWRRTSCGGTRPGAATRKNADWNWRSC